MKGAVLFLIVVFCAATAQAMPGFSGSGTSGDPYRISSVSDLALLANIVAGGNSYQDVYFQLTTDLDLNVDPFNTGTGWQPIGTQSTPFQGHFDGNAKKITGLMVNNPSVSGVGLFGYVNGTILNLDVETAPGGVTGDQEIGILAGNCTGAVSNCQSAGSVAGVQHIGGLIGYSSATIGRCFSSATVGAGSGTNLGGLVGFSGANITNCYATGAVSGSNVQGGLVGDNGATSTISSCYAVGAVANNGWHGGLVGYDDGPALTDSYWDVTTTTQDASSGSDASFGKVTADMKTMTTFAGWDFSGIWRITGTNYPVLRPSVVVNNYALSFNGVSDGVTIPGNSAWAVGTGDFTVEWWQYQTDNNMYPRVFAVGDDIFGVSLENYFGTWKMFVWLGGAENDAALGSYKNQWTHFAVTRSSGTVTIYKNGDVIGSDLNNGDANDSSSPLYLGREEVGNCFGGQLDEFRIWNIARSQSDIQSTMYTGLAGNESGLVAYYQMSDGSGTTLTDNSSGGHDGTISGATWTTSTAPMPVELTSFTAAAGGASVSLSWKTATEVNNHGFDIERRTIGSTAWMKIGFVAGSGTSNKPRSYSFLDKTAASGSYAYRLKQVDNDGTFKYSAEAQATVGAPKAFALAQNYPNPFNPSTRITYDIAAASDVLLAVYDILGRQVAVLANGRMEPGRYTAEFNGAAVANGVYFYRLEAGSYSKTMRLVLMK